MATRTQNAKGNIIWGVFNNCVIILMPFISRTVMIYTMGMQYVGLGSLFTSLLGVLSFAELGIGGALVFSMYEPIAKGDDSKVCALLNFYRKCYLGIGMIILIVGLMIMPFLNYFIEGEIPDNINIYVLFSVYLLNNVIGYFFFAYRYSLFLANQRVDLKSKIDVSVNFFMYVIQIAILILFRNYYIYVIVIPVCTLTNNILGAVITRKMYPQYVCRGKIPKEEKRSIREKVSGMVFQKIGGIILTSVDTIVISAFLGLRVLGIYNVYYYIITALFGFLTVIQQSIIPVVGNSIVTESKEKNFTDFKKFSFMYIWLISWWGVCLVCLYQPFVRLWVGEENMLPFGLVILLAVYFYTYKMADLVYIYKEAIGLWWQGKLVPVISSVCNLILNLILVNFIGLAGIVISTIVSIVLVSVPYGSWILFKYYFQSRKDWMRYLRRLLLYAAVTTGIGIVTWEICHLIGGMGWIAFIMKVICCLIIPNVLLFVVYCKSRDFKNAFSFILGLLPEKIKTKFIS